MKGWSLQGGAKTLRTLLICLGSQGGEIMPSRNLRFQVNRNSLHGSHAVFSLYISWSAKGPFKMFVCRLNSDEVYFIALKKNLQIYNLSSSESIIITVYRASGFDVEGGFSLSEK